MNGFAKFLAGVIVGGAAVALLTPTSGEDLRARIKEILKRKGLLADQKLEDCQSISLTPIMTEAVAISVLAVTSAVGFCLSLIARTFSLNLSHERKTNGQHQTA